MHFIKTSAIALLTIIALTACGDKDKKTSEAAGKDTAETSPNLTASSSRLEGAWEIKRAEGAAAEMNVGTIYEFNGEKLTLSGLGMKNPGTTEITDSTFSFEDMEKKHKLVNHYQFKGDTLIVKTEGLAEQVFYLVKK